MPYPSHPNYTCRRVQITKLLLCSFLHPPATSSLFGPNILSTLFSKNLNLCSFLNVRDQVSQPYRTTGKIIVLYILNLRFSTADEKTEGSGLKRMYKTDYTNKQTNQNLQHFWYKRLILDKILNCRPTISRPAFLSYYHSPVPYMVISMATPQETSPSKYCIHCLFPCANQIIY
jgi:hypothetical protein